MKPWGFRKGIDAKAQWIWTKSKANKRSTSVCTVTIGRRRPVTIPNGKIHISVDDVLTSVKVNGKQLKTHGNVRNWAVTKTVATNIKEVIFLFNIFRETQYQLLG